MTAPEGRVRAESIVLERFTTAAAREVARRAEERSPSPSSPAFVAALGEIEVAASSCAQGLCAALVSWRASAPGGATAFSRSHSSTEGDARSTAADAVFAEAVVRALRGYDGSNVDAGLLERIEEGAVGRVVLGVSDGPASEALLTKLSRYIVRLPNRKHGLRILTAMSHLWAAAWVVP